MRAVPMLRPNPVDSSSSSDFWKHWGRKNHSLGLSKPMPTSSAFHRIIFQPLSGSRAAAASWTGSTPTVSCVHKFCFAIRTCRSMKSPTGSVSKAPPSSVVSSAVKPECRQWSTGRGVKGARKDIRSCSKPFRNRQVLLFCKFNRKF